jgi:hypothetical protein
MTFKRELVVKIHLPEGDMPEVEIAGIKKDVQSALAQYALSSEISVVETTYARSPITSDDIDVERSRIVG